MQSSKLSSLYPEWLAWCRPPQGTGRGQRTGGSRAPTQLWRVCLVAGLAAGFVAEIVGGPTFAAADPRTPPQSRPLLQASGGVWKAQGPGPILEGAVENIPPRNDATGAVNTAAPHPAQPAILYAGAVNGGIWRTLNAEDQIPFWIPMTDHLGSLSIGALEFDPTDSTHQTLVAGVGHSSSFLRTGGPLIGVLHTSNGGLTWAVVNGNGRLLGMSVSGVAARGNVFVAAVDKNPGNFIDTGVYYSPDAGVSFSTVSGAVGTGLPIGPAIDLASDPRNVHRLYTVLLGLNVGIYRSENTGFTWTDVSSPALKAALVSATNAEIAIGQHGNLYVAVVAEVSDPANGQPKHELSAIFRSGDDALSWQAMEVPFSAQGGLHPGGQGDIHLSIAADPDDASVVYVGGDAQYGFGAAIGATNRNSGRLFRGNASKPIGDQWVHLTHSSQHPPEGGGTASNSAPHADSRQLVFDAVGRLIDTNDGGVYRRTLPHTEVGDWTSVNGNLQVTEFHSVAYDAVSNVLVGGSQDNGVPEQLASSSLAWLQNIGGDGGVVVVNDTTFETTSFRIISSQFLGNFRRQAFDAHNNRLSTVIPRRNLLGTSAPMVAQFYTPVVANQLLPQWLIFGAQNSVYESKDNGETIQEISPGVQVNGFGHRPIAYGARDNLEALYFGSQNTVYLRPGPHPTPSTPVYSGSPADTIAALAMDIDTWRHAFAVVQEGRVLRTTDGGASWFEITSNLSLLPPGSRFHAAAFIADPSIANKDALVVGGDQGVFITFAQTGFLNWSKLGTGLPLAPVYDLEHDPLDDLLVAGTLGRGAWILNAPTTAPFMIFRDGFDSGDLSQWD